VSISKKFSMQGFSTLGIDILTWIKLYWQIEEELHSTVNARFVCAG
jgi:hypothetical protein